MSYFGIINSLKNWRHTIITAIEMAVIIVLIIVSVSVYEKQSKTYKPFKNIITHKGVEFFNSNRFGFYVTDDGTYNMSDFLSNLKDVDSCVFSLNKQIWVDGDNRYATTIIGLDDTMKAYEPELVEGSWLRDDNALEVVITDNPYGLKVGDTIDLVDYLDDDFAGYITVKICGVVKNGSYIYKGEGITKPESVNTIFDVFDGEHHISDKNSPYIFMSKSLLEKSFDRVSVCNSIFIKYKDNISAENVKANNKYLEEVGVYNSFEDINSNSLIFIKKQLEMIIPLLACVVLLVSVSLAVTSAINTYEEQEMYAVCYLTGMKRAGIVKIKLIESIITILTGLGIFVVILNLMKIARIDRMFEFKFYVSEIYLIVAFLVYMVLIKTFASYMSIRKKSCSDLIRKAKI